MTNLPKAAIVTASYAGDLERCRLLCASMDRFVTGWSKHYLLVEDRDVAAFRALESVARVIVPESALFPDWLKSRPDPSNFGRRRIWTGPGALMRGVPPLRGWHAQQLRKLALPALMPDEVYLYADSDLMFLRPFDLAALSDARGTRLYRKPAGLTADMPEHVSWCRSASGALGLPEPAIPSDDYINNLVSWTKANILALHAQLEHQRGRHWIAEVAATRNFSECMVYGYFVERVLGVKARHWAVPLPLAKTIWGPEEWPAGGIAAAAAGLGEGQVAIGVQSFIGAEVTTLRAYLDQV
ncbi:MAG: DUF6492 family protein [Bosea sp. (in: a-proteobacteria)]